MRFIAVIPARYASSRLPGKPLADIGGKPMVVHVLERAMCSGAVRVIVATDHQGIKQVVEAVGGEVCMTKGEHPSGTERLAEVITHYGFGDDEIVVNVQGDEPLIPPVIIRQVASNLARTGVGMATLAVPITEMKEAFNPNVVKVVRDKQGYALYFSRAPIPWERDNFALSQQQITQQQIGNGWLRHIGLYAYRAGFIRRYRHWEVSELEQLEKLEQLRVLWHGEKIHVDIADRIPEAGVDTPEDLLRMQHLIINQSSTKE